MEAKTQSRYNNERVNKNTTKSIYLNHLLYTHDYVKMSSLASAYKRHKEKKDLTKQTNNAYKEQHATFTVQVPNTSLTIQRLLPCLHDVNKQDMFKWKSIFYETIRLCNWSEETAITVLENVVHTDYLATTQEYKALDDKVNALMNIKYPTTHFFHIKQQLASVKQEDFYTIKDFMQKIDEFLQRLALIKPNTPAENREKREEAFYTGLSNISKVEMRRHNIVSFKDMYDTIHSTEQLILHNTNAYNRTHSNDKRPENSYRKENTSNKKYCTFHKTNTRDTKECRKVNANTTKSDEKKSYAIMEKRTQPKTMELKITTKNKSYNGLIDTGSV